jgi:hypothetical protein
VALHNSTKFVNSEFRLAIKVLVKYTIYAKMEAHIRDFNLRSNLRLSLMIFEAKWNRLYHHGFETAHFVNMITAFVVPTEALSMKTTVLQTVRPCIWGDGPTYRTDFSLGFFFPIYCLH